MTRTRFLAALLLASAARAQSGGFLHAAFAAGNADRTLLLSPDMPNLELMLANRPVSVKTRQDSAATLTAPDSEVLLDARLSRVGAFEYCRIRPAKDSFAAEELKLIWRFPLAYNESMTLDADALEGHPLYLPDGTIPPAHHLNWGTLYYNRERNLAVGAVLAGGMSAASNWGARSGPSSATQLHIWTQTGSSALEVTIFAWRPKEQRLWWAEWYQEEERHTPGVHPAMFPVLSPFEISWAPGERQTMEIVPAPRDEGRSMEWALIDDVSGQVVARRTFTYSVPVTHLSIEVGDWPTGLYRAVIVPAGAQIDGTARRLSEKMINLIVRPARGSGQILFVAPTDMWRAYAANGGHAMTSWRESWHYDSVGYSPTVLNTRFRRNNHYYYGLYERYSDIRHYRYLRELARRDGLVIDYATQDDVARGRVRLADYRLVLLGSHAEFTTLNCFLRFREYLARGGAVMIHGGDTFAVIVDYLPSPADPRYIRQRDHVWMHLTYQDDNFRPPQLVPSDPGDAIDYLNVFHVSVAHWPPSERAIVANVDHAIMRGLGLKIGDPVPGRWAGEADMIYEPAAWDVLVRSPEATTEPGEDFQERVRQAPFHRPGLSIHKNLRLALVSGENFTGILDDPANTLFRSLYVRTLHYLLDTEPLAGEGDPMTPEGAQFIFPAPATVRALRYRLPEFIDFSDPLWFRKPAPYAHFVVEGSADGRTWKVLSDRRYGPWRGVQTDLFPPTQILKVRLRGTFSNGQEFRVEDVRVFR
jgi:N,N-dimethylformamidase beta subunit-like, C-terminal